MGSLCSLRPRNRRPSRDFSGTLSRLEDAWRYEARFRLLLLSVIMAVCLLSGNFLLLLSAYLPPAASSSGSQDPISGVAGIAGLLLAFLRLWPEVRRCRPRIAELQNAANRIQYLSERKGGGLKVSTQEWENAFEAAQALVGAGGGIQDDER